MGTEGNDWERLAARVVERREQQGWTQIDVATRGGLSLDRIQAIEGARNTTYRGSTLVSLERGLCWAPGSVKRILRGGEPTSTIDVQHHDPEPAHPASQPQQPPRTDRGIGGAVELLRTLRDALGPGVFGAALQQLQDEGKPDLTRHTERRDQV